LINCLDLCKDFELEELDDIDYKTLQAKYDNTEQIMVGWNSVKDNLIIALPIINNNAVKSNKKTNLAISSENNPESNNQLKICVFDKNGKFVQTIGKNNSFTKDGYIALGNIETINDQVQIYDQNLNKLIVFENYQFLYNIDSTDPLNHVKLSLVQCWQGRGFGYQPYRFDWDNFDSAFVCQLKDDPDYPETKTVHEISTFFDVRSYKNEIFSDFILNQDMERLDPPIRSMISALYTDTVYFYVKFSIQKDGTFYAVNNYGTEIHFYSIDNKMDNSFHLKEIAIMRKEEKENFHLSYRDFSNVFHFSYLNTFFVDMNNRRAFCFFIGSDIMEKKYGSKKLFYIYSFSSKNGIIPILPIDFIPVCYDENDNILIAIKIENYSITVQFYKV
jgi:hypothetical protein